MAFILSPRSTLWVSHGMVEAPIPGTTWLVHLIMPFSWDSKFKRHPFQQWYFANYRLTVSCLVRACPSKPRKWTPSFTDLAPCFQVILSFAEGISPYQQASTRNMRIGPLHSTIGQWQRVIFKIRDTNCSNPGNGSSHCNNLCSMKKMKKDNESIW